MKKSLNYSSRSVDRDAVRYCLSWPLLFQVHVPVEANASEGAALTGGGAMALRTGGALVARFAPPREG